MIETTPEQDFAQWRTHGDAEALGAVFDALAPQLLLVAAHLAGGGSAEDLVQATFVDAIRHKQRWDGRRPLAPWLCGILANHVRLELRRRQRRPVPDATRLRGNAMAAPADAAEAAELAEVVRAAVAGLPVQYHQVLSLRFLHGLELQQIAHSLRLPLGTVKTRLYRGMALVKRALPAGLATAFAAVVAPGRGLAAVREVVLGHAGAAAGAAAGTAGAAAVVAALSSGALIGAVAMQKLLVAVAVVVVLVGGWFAVETLRREPLRPQVAATNPARVVASQAGVHEERQPARAPEHAQAARTANERIAAATTGGIAVHAVWKVDGAPASGVDVDCNPSRRRPGEKVQRHLHTDTDGRARLDGLEPGRWFVGVPPQQPAVEVTVGATTTVELAIGDHVEPHVQVVDGDGRPVVGAEVWADGQEPGPPRRLGATDPAGSFTCRTLPVNAVFARKVGCVPAMPVNLAKRTGACDVRLVLDTMGCTLRGTVVDPDGRPVADALVVVGIDDSYSFAAFAARGPVPCRTDADGRFTCSEALPGEHTVMARAGAFATSTQRVDVAAEGETGCTLVLQVGGVVQGRVTDRAGQPLVDAVVSTSEGLLGMQDFPRELSVRTDQEGRYRLAGLRPGKQEVVIEGDPLPSARRWFELEDGGIATWDAKLPEGGDIAGRVVDGDGKPLAFWIVYAIGVEEIGSGVRPHEATSTSDRVGTFTLAGLPDLPYRIAVLKGTMQGPTERVARAVVEGVRPPRDDLVIRIDGAGDAGGWITVRVVRPAAAAGSPVLVSANPGTRNAGNGPMPQDLLAAAKDTGRLGPLPAGDYVVSARLEGHNDICLPKVHLAAGQNLELPAFRFDEQRPLRLRLRHGDGRAATGAMLMLVGPGLGWLVPQEDKDHPGDYLTEPLRPGDYEMRAHGPGFAAEAFQLTVGQEAETLVEHVVQAGVAVALHFVPAGPPPERWLASIRVQLRDAQGDLVSETVLADGKGGFSWSIDLRPGTYTLDVTARPGGVATLPFTVTDTAAANPIEVQLTNR